MLEVSFEGGVARIDVRERILGGEHPRGEIVDYIQQAQRGTVVEIHLPHPAPPLVAALKSIGLHSTVNELAPDHYRLMCVKL